MHYQTTVSFIYSFLILIILSSTCTTSMGNESSDSCYMLGDSLENIYFAQVDFIRRGVPTRIVQSEFTWGFNYFFYADLSFQTKELSDICIRSYSWDIIFAESYRMVYILSYLRDIRQIFPDISFLSFEEYPTLPPMSQREHDLVQAMWQTTLVRLQSTPRTRNSISDFPFPQNIDVLYDPNRDQACEQYNKFRTGHLYNSTEEIDSESVLVALTLVSVNLYKKGGNAEAITQLLRHFVGYVFDGIRCLRMEGPHITIPNTLVEAYSRNIGMIIGTVNQACQDCGNITSAAVSHVFKDEIQALLSYNSWGKLQYAILSPVYSYTPIKVDFITKIFRSYEFNLLLFYSSSPGLIPSGRTLADSSLPLRNETVNKAGRNLEDVICDGGYVLMPRKEEVTHPLKHCCNEICYRWSLLMRDSLEYSAEDCCSKCNQANHCDSKVTFEDWTEINDYSFFVPEYGDQDQIDLYLVVL